ncbi:MAG: phenylalanine--tRNA ligase subunit beta [Candidatus Nanopelagicales bacterium]|nr:phenylalanine--tRNA ligase subunit beta [Candidatus Nanopelagicales bacterium]
MRAPLSWIREFAALPPEVTGRDLAERLIAHGLEVETVYAIGAGASGPFVVGRVERIEELTEFRKPIRLCQVDVGPSHGGEREIICGARNFAPGDLVVVALPGATLPGGMQISARETYGHVSNGMICSERELGIGEESGGIIVLAPGEAEVGLDVGPRFGIGEEILDIAVTPDRGYAMSIRGIAREAAIAYAVDFVDPVGELAELSGVTASSMGQARSGVVPVQCRTDDPIGCRSITMRTLTGIDVSTPSPQWLRARIIAAGMRPINVVVDVTNYVMLESGQPLHAFDADRVVGTLVARRAAGGETLVTLDGVERQLDVDDLVIADDTGPVALAGTMGGESAEVGANTMTIALEAACFEAITVARMSRRHKLSTEASRRFERGVDPALAPFASHRAAALIAQLAGGASVGMTGQELPLDSSIIRMSATEPADVSGASISPERVVGALEAVGCRVENSDSGLRVTPATWRPDLVQPADLVEEVLRLVGYDAVPSVLPVVPTGGGLTVRQRLRRIAARAVAEIGLIEVLTYPFIGSADFDRLGLAADDPRRNTLALLNPLSAERPGLRTTLLSGVLETASRNISRGHDSVLIFEIGPVFLLSNSGVEPVIEVRPGVEDRPSEEQLAELRGCLPHERLSLGGVLCGAWEPGGWWGSGRDACWADAIEAARFVAGRLGIELTVEAASQPADAGPAATWHPTRRASLSVAGRFVGWAGEVHPRVAAAFGLPGRAGALELDLDTLIELAEVDPVPTAPTVWTMPLAKEDLALVVDESVTEADVAAALRSGTGPVLESLRLFDVYRGPQVGPGRKSLAFSLRFRAPDHTLKASELSTARLAALAAANEATGAELRQS